MLPETYTLVSFQWKGGNSSDDSNVSMDGNIDDYENNNDDRIVSEYGTSS